MAYEHKEGSGAIFKNTKKAEGSKQPDFRGDVLIGGTLYEIAGWTKNAGKGPFLSINVKPKESTQQKEGGGKRYAEDIDSNFPF